MNIRSLPRSRATARARRLTSTAAASCCLLLLSLGLLPSAHGRIYLTYQIGFGSGGGSGSGSGNAADDFASSTVENGTTYESMPALFGKILDGDQLYEGRLQFLRENPYLCDPITNVSASSFVVPRGPDIPDSHGGAINLAEPVVLLASRGVCPFLKKAQVAQDIHPSVQYLIVFNFNTGGSGGGFDAAGGGEDTFVPMFAEYGDSRLSLLSVTHRTGQALKQYLAAQPPQVLELGGPVISFDDSPPAGLLSVDDLRDMLLSALGLFFMLISFSGCILMVAGTYGVLQPNGTGGIRVHLTNTPDDNVLGVYVSNRSGLLTPQQVQRLRERSNNNSSSRVGGDVDINVDTASSDAAMGVDSSENCCAVCLDEFSTEWDVLTLPECQHAFHTECITPWLTERQAKCPLCKHDVLAYVLRMDSKMDAAAPSQASGEAGRGGPRSIWNWLARRNQWALVAPFDPSGVGGHGVVISPEEMALDGEMDDEDRLDGNRRNDNSPGMSNRQGSSSLEMAPSRGRRGVLRQLHSQSS